MEDWNMSTKEILKYIKREENYIKKMENEIIECKYEISASQRAIDNWKKQLKIAEKAAKLRFKKHLEMK